MQTYSTAAQIRASGLNLFASVADSYRKFRHHTKIALLLMTERPRMIVLCLRFLPVLLQFPAQRAARDAQLFRGATPMAAGACQSIQDNSLFHPTEVGTTAKVGA